MSRQQQIDIDTPAGSEQAPVTPAWGERLKETRIRRGLTVAEVADALHLELPLVEAMEAEDCERLPGSSFVKGYLRNYAKLLEADAEPVLAAYSQVCGNDEPALTQVTRIKEVSSRDGTARYITWSLVLVVLISLGLWWWSEVLKPADEQAVAPQTDALAPGLEAPPVTELPPVPEPPAPPVEIEPPSTAAPVEAPVEEPPAAPEAQAPAESVEPQVEETAPTLDRLTLSFSEESWVEIEDGRGQRLFMDLARAGQTRIVEGQPPFEILLGNAAAVSLKYNGEVYQHAGQNRQGVARFTLGE